MTSNNGLGLIGQEQSGSYQNYHFDSRGSTLAMTDANGVVTDRFQYDSYGGSLSHTGASDTPFQYNGQFGVQTDPNGALVHARPLLQPGDEFWEKLSEGGETMECGWLKDKYGISWQIVPTFVGEMLKAKDTDKTHRTLKGLWQMQKLDIKRLKAAFDGRE